MATYPYATGDLLIERNTYFYTPFEGSDFLAAWEQDRTSAFRDLANSPLPNRQSSAQVAETIAAARHGGPVETAQLIAALYAALLSEEAGIRNQAITLIDRLVMRFEVFKRIHRAYGKGLRAVNKAHYEDLGLYVGAAELFERTYDRLGGLPYLNVLLKIIDTLCALRGRLAKTDQARLAWLIERERAHVLQLAASAGVLL